MGLLDLSDLSEVLFADELYEVYEIAYIYITIEMHDCLMPYLIRCTNNCLVQKISAILANIFSHSVFSR